MDKEDLLKLLNDIKEDDMPSLDEGERILIIDGLNLFLKDQIY